ncbi:MAG: Txe/YoeB family addiction module toxin [Streptococcaceae bacterium]|jgi:toxin YoeB|nr:Txe/YoeB family addiction module toxin [Streptococcaceae bacterium]
MIKSWSDEAWEDYEHWFAENNKPMIKRIHKLIRDIERNGYQGIGKPEPLKHDFSGYWSRRITDEHRLVYKLEDGQIKIAAARFHYK